MNSYETNLPGQARANSHEKYINTQDGDLCADEHHLVYWEENIKSVNLEKNSDF